ncbi:MAG: VOC family protein [Gemmatimonadaceae bacterium]
MPPATIHPDTREHGQGIRPDGYRLPAATRIGRVRLQVADLARSLAYYERILGMRVLNNAATSATLGAHGDEAPLVELHERAGARSAPRRGQLGLYHFAVLLPDRAALGRFIAHLAEVGAHAGMSDHLVSEAVYLTDPDGLGIEVYADRPRSDWRYEGRQLVMATEPLDAHALLRAARGESWTGMPAGTTIGHVHLHVGDIDAAAALYHGALGFDKVVWSYPGALFLSAGGYHHHLGVNTWAGAGARGAGPDDARLLDWELILPDAGAAEAAARSVERAGYAVSPVAEEGGAWRTADPWGTAVRLTASPPGAAR